MARSIRELAYRAHGLYPPKGGEDNVTLLEARIEEAYRELVHQCGGVYSNTQETSLTLSTRTFALPSDFREIRPKGVYLSYTPRTISAISRSTNVVTVTTSSVHGLAVGMTVKITGVTDTSFDEDSAVITALGTPTTTQFKYAQTGDAGSSSGGTVECSLDAVYLTLDRRYDLTLVPTYDATAGRPSTYWYPDARNISLEPISDGVYPALFVEYDGEAPDTLDLTATLPIPGYLENALMAYGAAYAGTLDMEKGLTFFNGGIRSWRAARSDREQYSGRAGRY